MSFPWRAPSQKGRLSSVSVGSGFLYSVAVVILLALLQDRCVRAVECGAASGDEAHFGVFHLALAAFAAHLANPFDDVEPAFHVRFGKIAAGGIDRKLAAQLDATAFDERSGFADFAETGVLEPQQHAARKVVVE